MTELGKIIPFRSNVVFDGEGATGHGVDIETSPADLLEAQKAERVFRGAGLNSADLLDFSFRERGDSVRDFSFVPQMVNIAEPLPAKDGNAHLEAVVQTEESLSVYSLAARFKKPVLEAVSSSSAQLVPVNSIKESPKDEKRVIDRVVYIHAKQQEKLAA